MPKHILLLAGCWSLVVTSAVIRPAVPQDPPPAPKLDSTEIRIKQTAAVEALRGIIKSHTFSLPEAKVRTIVIAHLQQDPSPSPKTMPAPEQLKDALDLDFDSLWNEMIDKATGGIDVKGDLKLANGLRAHLQKHPQLRSDTANRHADFLNNGLPQSLDRVKKQIVQKQTEELKADLQKVVGPEMPGPKLIGEAKNGQNAKVVSALTANVLENIDDTRRKILLVESHDNLSKEAELVVADGVRQLDEQLQVFQTQPDAIAQQGVQKELENRLQKTADAQKAARADDPLRPTYGVFARVAEALPNEAQRWFDQRVTGIGKQIAGDVGRGELPSPSQDQQDKKMLRQLILDDLSGHHRPEDSRQRAQPDIQEMVRAGQQWIVDRLVSSFEKSESPEDAGCSANDVRQDASHVLSEAGSQSNKAWGDLKRLLERHYEQQILPDVRTQIRDQQAQQYAPDLTAGKWQATEEDLLNCQLPLNQPALASLPVWSDAAPKEKEVLEETWQLWLAAAQDALQLVDNAIKGQREIVEQLRPKLLDQIRNGPARTREEWIDAYCVTVAGDWRKSRHPAADAYPDLFDATRVRISTIVSELLPQAERERVEAQQKANMQEEQQKKPPEESDVQNPPEQPPSPAPPSPKADPTENRGPGPGGGPEPKTEDPADGSDESAKMGGDAQPGQKEEGRTGADGEEASGGDENKTDDEKKGEGEAGEKDEQEKSTARRDNLESDLNLAFPPGKQELSDLLYRIGFWILLVLVLMMAAGWYWHVRYLHRLLAHYRRSGPLPLRP